MGTEHRLGGEMVRRANTPLASHSSYVSPASDFSLSLSFVISKIRIIQSLAREL